MSHIPTIQEGAALQVTHPRTASQASIGRKNEFVDRTFGLPSQIETVTGKLAVYQIGTGSRTIIFWPSIFSDHTIYRQQAIALGDEFRMIFIDGPGHGGSGPQTHGATLDTHAKSVVEVMDRLGVEKAVVVGTSWGGLVGTRLARMYPERMAALVALNTPFDTKKGGPGISARMNVFLARMTGTTALFANGVAGSFFTPSSRRTKMAEIGEFKSRFAGFNPADMAVVARTVLLERKSEIPSLSHIAVPTIVVAGGEDQNVASVELKKAAALFADARFVEIPGSAHVSAIEAPETVNQLIRDASTL